MNVVATRTLLCSLISACIFTALGHESDGRPSATVRRAERPDSLGSAYGSSLWPKVNGVATVYYVIDAASDPNATPNIMAAIGTFNADFPGLIQWVPWSPMLGPNYVDIDLSRSNTTGQCEALEGYEGVPAQPMDGSTSCTIGTILHEMGHVIGLWHEQARPDSATYITIDYGNVIKGSWSYFQPPADNFQVLAAYDYASLMQYTSFAFSRNGGPVIETIPAGIPLAGSEGVPYPVKYDYSAGDKETIERLYGAAPTTVTITSNPVGLVVSVDGRSVTTPKTYAWALKSSHKLAVPSGIQTLTGDIAGSASPAPFYYTYGRWSDSTAQAHAITVKPGNGELAFPLTSPAVATYSANFIQLVPYSAAIAPAGSGGVIASPAPTSYSGGAFYTARQPVSLTAQPAAGWAFYEFDNAPFNLPGGLGANPKSFYVPDTGNPIAATVKFSDEPVYSVSLTNDYPTSNLSIFADGIFEYTPKNFSPAYDAGWTPGTMHTFTFYSPESPYSINTRFAFAHWNAATFDPRARFGAGSWPGGRSVAQPLRRSGGGRLSGTGASRTPASPATAGTRLPSRTRLPAGGVSETVTLPSAGAAYGATVTPQFAPATNFGYPPCGGTGTITPASPTGDGFYPSGKKLTFQAAATGGWTFAGWSYDLAHRGNPASLVATDETLVFANFNTTAVPLVLTKLSPASAVAGAAGFTLVLDGRGFAPSSLVTFNGNYPAVTYVSSTVLKAAIPSSYVATAGNYQVAVENFPVGSTGCAVFGYAPFFVKSP